MTLHDFSPGARFYRAFYDSMISVLYYAAWKGVLPVFICKVPPPPRHPTARPHRPARRMIAPDADGGDYLG